MSSIRTYFAASLTLVLGGAAGCDTLTINHGNQGAIEARAETLAGAFCAAYAACDCTPFGTDAPHPDPEQCEARERDRILRAFEAAEDRGLSFDQGCMDQLLDRYQALDCSSFASIQAELGNPELAENFGCALYHGEVEGGICEALDGTSWSDCAQGSRCSDGYACQPVLAAGEVGDDCAYNSSAWSLDCAAGLVCDQFDGCQPGQALGEACKAAGDGTMRCGPELRCVTPDAETIEGTCQPLLTAGEPCDMDEDCHGWCRDGACVAVPALCLYPSLQPPVVPL